MKLTVHGPPILWLLYPSPTRCSKSQNPHHSRWT